MEAIVWVAIIFFGQEPLLLFGAGEYTLSLAKEYVLSIKYFPDSLLCVMP